MNRSADMALPPPKAAPVPRPRKACTICRGLKTRCLPETNNSDPQAPCSRCARLNLNCDYTRAKRGRNQRWGTERRPKDDGILRDHEASRDAKTGMPIMGLEMNHQLGSHQWDILHQGRRAHFDGSTSHVVSGSALVPAGVPSMGNDLRVLTGASSSIHDASLTGTSLGTLHPSSVEIAYPSHVSLETGPSPHQTLGYRQSSLNSILDYLEPHLDTENSQPHSPSGHNRSPYLAALRTTSTLVDPALTRDPVDSQLLSEQEAQQLFQQFEKVAATSGLFDHQYHTYQRVRNSSPVLFTSIMYAVSKYWRPDISESLLSMAEGMINAMVQAGEVDLWLVQALLVLIQWKRPSDKSAYLKLGLAVRILYQLKIEWPASIPRHFRNDEEERRQIDGERTYYNVIWMDLVFSVHLHFRPSCQPSQLPPTHQIGNWVKGHENLNIQGDMFKVFVSGLRAHVEDLANFPLEPLDQNSMRWTPYHYEVREEELNRHIAQWMNGTSLEGIFRLLAALFAKLVQLKLRSAGLLHNMAPNLSTGDLLTLVEEILVLITEVAHTGDIIFWSDMWCHMLNLPGLIMYSVRSFLNVDQLTCMGGVCREMCSLFEPLSQQHGEHALQYVDRTYRRLWKTFDQLSQGGSDDPRLGSTFKTLIRQWPAAGPLPNEAGGNTVNGNQATLTQPPEWNWIWSAPLGPGDHPQQ